MSAVREGQFLVGPWAPRERVSLYALSRVKRLAPAFDESLASHLGPVHVLYARVTS